MFGLVAVMLMASGGELSAPPLVTTAPESVAPPVAPPPTPPLRPRTRVRGSVALGGMAGVVLREPSGGAAFSVEFGTLRNDAFSIAALASLATTFVTQVSGSATLLLSHVLGERFTLGGGPTLLGAWAIGQTAPFGSVVSFGGTVRGEVFLFTRNEGELRRQGPSISGFFTAGVPLLGAWGPLVTLSPTIMGGASIGWTWW